MKKEYKLGILIAVLAALYFGYLAVRVGPVEVGNAGTTSLSATYATSTNFAVTTSVLTLQATSTCVSRTIVTTDNSIDLTFGDQLGDRLTGFAGIRQNASTTKEYDAADYGCGLVRVRADGGNTTIFFSEYR